ncbi:MAG: sensor domain-containing diguanylate cyclase [Actinomycetota bacterium]|nr:sensor domain-containing diguanylate cyclase [Actinomycetota bacterium]
MTLAPERAASGADQELHRLARLGALLETSPHASIVHSLGVIRWANEAAAAVLGLRPDDLVGQPLLRWIAPESYPAVIERLRSITSDGGVPRGTTELVVTNGSTRLVVEAIAAKTTWEGEPAVHAVLWDVTGRRAEADQLGWEATHDALTGLLNRSGILAILEQALAPTIGATGPPEPVGVVMIDLDGFKSVNDHLGHNVGDRTLVEVATRLAEACGPLPVGRLGGDEFLVVVEDTAKDEPRLLERLSREITTRVAGPDGTGLVIGASLGVATGIPGTTSLPELLGAADRAMYEVKRAGRRSPSNW